MSNLVSINQADKFTVMATKIAQSGMFNIKNVNQAYTLMLIAEAEGKHFIDAMREYHVLNGKPVLQSREIQSRFQECGGRLKWVKSDDNEAEAVFFHDLGGEITIKWDINKAKKAGIYDSNPTWKKYPSNMLRARVITDGVIAIYPSCLKGALPQTIVEDTEEIKEEAEIIEDMEIVDTEKDIKAMKVQLKIKLKKLNFSDTDVQDFAKHYKLNDTIETLEKLVSDEKTLLEYVENFENKEI